MKNNENSKNSGASKQLFAAFPAFCKKNAAYLILLVCLGIAAIAVAVLVPNAKQQVDPNDSVSRSEDERISEATNDPHATRRPLPNGALGSTTPIPDFTQSPTGTTPPSHALLSPPVQGPIIWGFAINELIYSKTLDQWTTHAGVDIACKVGDTIRAVADGTIERVYTDTGLGTTVIIAHKNGDKSIYANLANDATLVAQGAQVKANNTIGTCGKTAKFESADKPHLHFEYHVNSSPVNPVDYVLFVSGS